MHCIHNIIYDVIRIVYPSSVDYISITMYDDTYMLYLYYIVNILGFYYIYERG